MTRVEIVVPAMEPSEIPRDKGVDVFVLDSDLEVVLTGERAALETFLREEGWGGDEDWIRETIANAPEVTS